MSTLTEAKSAFVVRLSGPTALNWSLVGPRSIGRSDLPLNRPFLIKDISVRAPSHDGNAHMKNAGGKGETINLQIRTVAEIMRDIRGEYPSLEWHAFDTLDEATNFLSTGKTDLELLEVPMNYTEDDLTKSYRALMVQNHPDKGGDVNTAQIITAAHKRLKEKLNNARS